MSLETAVEAVRIELNKLEDIRDISELGIPDDAIQGPFDRLYLEPDEERFIYDALHAVEPTSSDAVFVVLLVLHQDNVPEGQTLIKYTLDKVKEIRQLLQTANDPVSGAFLKDGDQGFRSAVDRIRYQFRPTDPVAAAVIDIAVESYTC